jgi:unsaturated chondroitin disaccharide hydrolase
MLILLVCTAAFMSCTSNIQPTMVSDSQMKVVTDQLTQAVDFLGDTSRNPAYATDDNSLVLVPSNNHLSGFFPGSLWQMYEFSRDEKWMKAASHFTANIEEEKYNGGTHDMGFKMFCSYGNAYRLTRQRQYRDVLIQSANTLITRYNHNVGCIRSWDHHADKWDYPVIIDNMMNLELLFWATRETSDSIYFKIARKHAETTLKNHFREDNSSYHVVSYDTLTGEVVKRNTHQGHAHESAWARGQAWGLYGFTMTYRETGDKRFLEKALGIADFILNHPRLPEDMIPYWDFDAPNIPDAERDASAGAIIASALYELSTYCEDVERDRYLGAADKILASLSSEEYLASPGTNNFFLLKHSVGNHPLGRQIDVPLANTDYYYLEANLRKLKLSGNWEPAASIVLKLDDLIYVDGGPVSKRWDNFASLVTEKEIPAAIGIIGNSLEKGNGDYFEWIRERNESGLFEFWNHGFDHSRILRDGIEIYEFDNSSLQGQVSTLKKTQDLAREKLGIEFVTFGAPYNHIDQNTVTALEEFPEIGIWLYGRAGTKTSKTILSRTPTVGIEYPVHKPVFYHFWNSFYFRSGEAIIVIQGHPNSWSESRLREFEMIVDYLKEIEVPIVKPSSFI